MQYERVVKGIGKYIEAEIYPGLSDWQEILARIAVSRAMNSQEQLKEILTKNAFAKMFAIIDDEGDIDVDGLMEEKGVWAPARECMVFRLCTKPSIACWVSRSVFL